MGDERDDRYDRDAGDDRHDRRGRDDRRAGGSLPATGQAENAELTLDEDLEPAEPARDAAEQAERLEGHSEKTDTPAHPESPPKREAPPS